MPFSSSPRILKSTTEHGLPLASAHGAGSAVAQYHTRSRSSSLASFRIACQDGESSVHGLKSRHVAEVEPLGAYAVVATPTILAFATGLFDKLGFRTVLK